MYNIGDKVRVVEYGSLFFSFESNFIIPKRWNIIKQSDPSIEPYGVICDTSPELVGQEGIVMQKSDVQGKYCYALEGIKGKFAWYDERQLELVSKNNNYE